MTDFEKIVAECIRSAQGNVIAPEVIAEKWSAELMHEARKQVASEIDIKSMYENKRNCFSRRNEVLIFMTGYKEGIEDIIKKIKGE